MINVFFRSLCALLLLVLSWGVALAQPTNQDCETALPLNTVTSWCSAAGAYTNVGGGDGPYSPAACFNGETNDVWFSFVAQATDVVIDVFGSSSTQPGGTLTRPEIALYTATGCGGTINEVQCERDLSGQNLVELYKGGLTIGETYLIRIDGQAGRTGTFQICINNYNPPVEPGGDCPSASILCDKSGFTVQSVNGTGQIAEAQSTCLNGESSSTWFKWTCEAAGTLSFTIKPNKADDDIDFVVYELPNGINNCAGMDAIRCEAAGDQVFPSVCMGPTGLRDSSNDTEEPAGCQSSNDNWVKSLNMEAGKSYALLVNNFTSTGTGFSITFGGTGTFKGPDAEFTDNVDNNTICIDQSVTFTDASSFDLGTITQWQWNFGVGAVPSSANTQGPHTVTYPSVGPKSVSLTVTTSLGCKITKIVTYNVDVCCETLNPIIGSATANNVLCPYSTDGVIDLSASGGYPTPNLTYLWSNGSTNQDISSLAPGAYMVTITDDRGCTRTVNSTVGSPPPIEITETVTKPTCNGGQDGAIQLQVLGGTSPYSYNWNNGAGFVATNLLSNIPIGDYTVTVRDANSCLYDHVVQVRELELALVPGSNTFTQPSCYGGNDGSITISISNGLAPYQYNYNNGAGFVPSNTLTGLTVGSYTVNVRDANGCQGQFVVDVTEPTLLEAQASAQNSSCFGADDGQATATATGGTGVYTYLWSNGDTRSTATNLLPGTHTVTVTDANGCTATATTSTTEPAELYIDNIEVQNALCFGATDGTLIVSASGGSAPYEYSTDNTTYQASNSLAGLQAGTYTVYVRDANGCAVTQSATITQPFQLVVNAGPDQQVDLGFSTEIHTTVNTTAPLTYAWTPTIGLSCTDCTDPSVMPPNTTLYYVQITDEKGCTALDSVEIAVNKIRPIYIPNAFSPNDDNTNDVFMVYGNAAALQIRTMRIFNRWGGLVFEAQNVPTNDPAYGWNGMMHSKKLNPGVYVYHIEIEFIDQEVRSYDGDVTLLR
jgi:gliding motility-associated-like protein